MRKILISVFDTEQAAFEGNSALKDMHHDGEITLYSSVVIAKDVQGVPSIRQQADRGPLGTLVGLIGGSLVGMLGGPVGVAVGAYVGGFAGSGYDLFIAGVGLDFVDEVSAALTPGKTAVVAEIDETWVAPIETRLGALGGVTFRRVPTDVLDEQLTREIETARTELQDLRAELHEASADTKSATEAEAEAQRRKLEALVARADKELNQHRAEFEAKLATLRKQQAAAREHNRSKIDARINKLESSYKTRQAKVEQAKVVAALELTREPLVPG